MLDNSWNLSVMDLDAASGAKRAHTEIELRLSLNTRTLSKIKALPGSQGCVPEVSKVFIHVQSCNVTCVQIATEWIASVHTSHMSKAVM